MCFARSADDGDVPPCPYGAQCYRQHNPAHMAEFAHPPRGAAPPPAPAPPPASLQAPAAVKVITVNNVLAGTATVKVVDVTNVPSAVGQKRKKPDGPADADRAAAKAAKQQERAAKQAAKEDEREARERRKTIGDAIKEGMRLPAEPGTLRFGDVRPAVLDLIFQDALPSASSSSGSFALTQRQLVAVFGTTKIEKGGSRDARYVCERALVRLGPGRDPQGPARDLQLDFVPKHMGSGVWWRN